jgi:hypothetical protein
MFIQSLEEVVGPVDKPRYLIIRKSRFIGLLAQRDYHPLPEMIGRNKQFAEYFERQWQQRVGDCAMVYTRTISGRKVLLKSRLQSLASRFQDEGERVNTWS